MNSTAEGQVLDQHRNEPAEFSYKTSSQDFNARPIGLKVNTGHSSAASIGNEGGQRCYNLIRMQLKKWDVKPD